jgi:hypothetical protein
MTNAIASVNSAIVKKNTGKCKKRKYLKTSHEHRKIREYAFITCLLQGHISPLEAIGTSSKCIDRRLIFERISLITVCVSIYHSQRGITPGAIQMN